MTKSTLRAICAGLCLLWACGASDPDHDPADFVDTDPQVPPANWNSMYTSDTPTYLAIYVQNNSTSGTTDGLTLSYSNKSGTYSCTISGPAAGATAGCTPTKSNSDAAVDRDKFYVAYTSSASSSDGLRFSSVKVTLNGVTYSKDTFDNVNGNLLCTGCNLVDANCGSCWIDGDDTDRHKCIEAKIPMDNNASSSSEYVQCSKSNS